MGKIFIFDYDDTLAWNVIDYNLTKVEFLGFLYQRLGHHAPDPLSVMKLNESINMKNIKVLGFCKERFPRSMMDTYKAICAEEGITDEDGERQAYEIGLGVYNPQRWQQAGLVEGAEEVLDFLVSKGDSLKILTKGDLAIQTGKVQATGVARWFGQEIYIVPDKTPAVLESLVAGLDKGNIWVVGNSEKSDIFPAYEVGTKAIYIPHETWKAEEVRGAIPESPRILRFGRIIEIKEKYDILV